jgi:hypothetical protein
VRKLVNRRDWPRKEDEGREKAADKEKREDCFEREDRTVGGMTVTLSSSSLSFLLS